MREEDLIIEKMIVVKKKVKTERTDARGTSMIKEKFYRWWKQLDSCAYGITAEGRRDIS